MIQNFDDFFSTLSNFSKHGVILAGNWNVVLNDRLDKNERPIHANKASKLSLKSYFQWIWIDWHTTWIKPYTKNSHSSPISTVYCNYIELFFFLIGSHLRLFIKKANVDASVKSDHKIVTITLNFESKEWGRVVFPPGKSDPGNFPWNFLKIFRFSGSWKSGKKVNPRVGDSLLEAEQWHFFTWWPYQNYQKSNFLLTNPDGHVSPHI